MKSKKPIVTIIQGFICAGKSTYSKNLAEETGAVRFNVDDYCLANFSSDELENNWNDCFEQSSEILWEKAASELLAGNDVILDFGFWLREDRDFARNFAHDLKVDFKHIYLFAEDEIILERMKKRKGPIAERNLENFETLRAMFEEPDVDEEHFKVESLDLEYKLFNRRQACEEYFDQVTALVSFLKQNSSIPFLRPPDEDYLKDSLGLTCTQILVFDKDKLIAYFFIKYFDKWPYYFADLGYPEKQSAVLKFIVVHDDYRGKSIGRHILRLAMNDIKMEGVKYILATVDPKNEASLAMVRAVGMKDIATRECFDNKLLRHIMFKEV